MNTYVLPICIYGKLYLVKSSIKRLLVVFNFLKKNNISDEQIIHINLEDADYDFQNYKELYK